METVWLRAAYTFKHIGFNTVSGKLSLTKVRATVTFHAFVQMTSLGLLLFQTNFFWNISICSICWINSRSISRKLGLILLIFYVLIGLVFCWRLQLLWRFFKGKNFHFYLKKFSCKLSNKISCFSKKVSDGWDTGEEKVFWRQRVIYRFWSSIVLTEASFVKVLFPNFDTSAFDEKRKFLNSEID